MSDLKVPVALVIAMIAQIVAGTFWVSKQAHRIEHLEKQVADNTEWVDQLYEDTDKLISFATFTENRWAAAYEEFGYTRQWGMKPLEKADE